MPDDVLGDGRVVAVESTMALDITHLEMGCIRPEGVPLPDAGRKAAMRVGCILGRMGTPVHPDRRGVAIDPSGNVPGHELLRDRVGFTCDLQPKWARVCVKGGVHLTLAFRDREAGDVVAQS